MERERDTVNHYTGTEAGNYLEKSRTRWFLTCTLWIDTKSHSCTKVPLWFFLLIYLAVGILLGKMKLTMEAWFLLLLPFTSSHASPSQAFSAPKTQEESNHTLVPEEVRFQVWESYCHCFLEKAGFVYLAFLVQVLCANTDCLVDRFPLNK